LTATSKVGSLNGRGTGRLSLSASSTDLGFFAIEPDVGSGCTGAFFPPNTSLILSMVPFTPTNIKSANQKK
jgi:hypothetical protein